MHEADKSAQGAAPKLVAEPIRPTPFLLNPSAVSLVNQTVESMNQFMNEMQSRMSRLETHVDKMQAAISVVRPETLSHGTSPRSTTSPTPTPVLALSSRFEPLWSTDHPFPPFSLQVVRSSDESTKTTNNGWVRVQLRDGLGRECSQLISGHSAACHVPIYDGVAHVSGLMLTTPSSKHGGHFHFEFSLLSSAYESIGPPLASPFFVIHPSRLNTFVSKLNPTDSVSKLPVIGFLHARRFALMGIDSINKLAKLDPDATNANKCGMKRSTLVECVGQARDVVWHQATRFPKATQTYGPDRPPKKRQVARNRVAFAEFSPLSRTREHSAGEPMLAEDAAAVLNLIWSEGRQRSHTF